MDTVHRDIGYRCPVCYGSVGWLSNAKCSTWTLFGEPADPRLLGIEICRDCGHVRRIHQPATPT